MRTQTRHALVDRILHGPGHAPADQRARAFRDVGPLPLLAEVATDSAAVQDALVVGFVFGVTARLANAFAFEVLSREDFDAGARYLLKPGYR